MGYAGRDLNLINVYGKTMGMSLLSGAERRASYV